MKKIQLFILIKKNNFDSFRLYNDRFLLTLIHLMNSKYLQLIK